MCLQSILTCTALSQNCQLIRAATFQNSGWSQCLHNCFLPGIHPKRWFPRFQESADNFEFSAERLSENAKSIKITLFAERLTAISPIYVQSLLNLSTKTLKHTICSTKMPHWHQILVIFMIYAILSRNFAVRMYALFPQISLDWKTEFRRRYPFLDVWCT